ncbi:CGNR zinc finger domain-containing protein [Actinacidiphila paucisporea]|uniref:CGNR zinc finger domain-containing protein n=1 Tax=Actinacidiphila paucisporea TaxID=310782 RepID=UPI000936EEA6|nr:CGNR zinc finger domain-containing protein [Actinacidiphila paucisporea]
MEQPGVRDPAPEPLRLVQDLVNTVDLEGGSEELRTAEEAADWARGRGLSGRGYDADALADVLTLREALRDVCAAHAGTDVPAATTAALDRLLARAPLRLAVDAEGRATVVPAGGLAGADELAAAVAAAIVRATADGTWPRLKACAAGTCRWVYYDRSPAGRSRWCTMAICGSRAKMRTYRKNGRVSAPEAG